MKVSRNEFFSMLGEGKVTKFTLPNGQTFFSKRELGKKWSTKIEKHLQERINNLDKNSKERDVIEIMLRDKTLYPKSTLFKDVEYRRARDRIIEFYMRQFYD